MSDKRSLIGPTRFLQAFKVLGYIGGNKAFSQETVKALRTINGSVVVAAAALMFERILLNEFEIES